jgi:DNA gyrase subunit A
MDGENSEEKQPEKIAPAMIEDEMKSSFIDYAMSVIVNRALPDVRDGLKPVHRRILYSMSEQGMLFNKPYKKCARIVGDCLGRYHPHGDQSVYEALVRMAQDFSLRYPLVDGQGNFGSVDGDSPAAMRYTEARLAKIASEILQDLDKETIDMKPNFDDSLKEPTVLPCKIPNLLINGSSGIAVGMATNIPPHNVKEVCTGVIEMINNPDLSAEELSNHIQGPDFPTGGIIQGYSGIRNYFKGGRGKVKVSSVAEIEEVKKKFRIIITEIPYMVNKSLLIEQMAGCVRDKRIKGITNLRDESDRSGMRIVVELSSTANPQVVLNQLLKYTRMKTTFGVNSLALVNNEPKLLNVKSMIQNFIEHRQVVIRRRTEYDLRKAEERMHIIEGLIIALDNIDEVIQKIKKSADVKIATEMLSTDYGLSEIQAKAILDMKLQKLSSLEQDKIREEHNKLKLTIGELNIILASEDKILNIIKEEQEEIRAKYGDERKTQIIAVDDDDDSDIDIEDMIEQQDCVVTISNKGYIKRLPIDTYKQQGRGGKGVIGAASKDEDFIEHLFIANTHSYILFFSNKGTVRWLKVYELPEGSRQARGRAIVNLLSMSQDEYIAAFVPVKEFKPENYLILATKKGLVKKTPLDAYSRPRKGGIAGITLDPSDALINAVLTDGTKQLIIATKNGQAVKFNEADARPIGRTSKGVRGVTLKGDDEVIDLVIASDDYTLLTVTENGYGKRTSIAEYRLINRGGSGVRNIQCSDRNGKVISVKTVSDEDDIILISQNGIVIRMPTKSISVIGRNTQGVRLMNLKSGDKTVAAAKIAREQDE